MDNKKIFMEILDGVDFRYGGVVDSPDQLVKLGEHVLAQYEALGEERQQRAEDLIGIILADALQPQVLARYHNASFKSVRRILEERLKQIGPDGKWGKYRQLAKQGIANLGLNASLTEQLNQQIDLLPAVFVEFVARLVSRFALLPREDAATLSLVLRDMFQEEAGHAERNRDN